MTCAQVEDELTPLLQRLRVGRPDKLAALKTVVDACAKQMVEGTLNPSAGAHRLWLWAHEVYDRRELFDELAIFVGLASEWDDHEDYRAEYEVQMVEEATKLLAAGGLRLSQTMNRDDAVTRLLEVLPEFRPCYEDSDAIPVHLGDELLIHVLMGDLARFYMAHGVDNPELAARYWRVVEELATQGDQAVQNAVHVSLIEWFAWGAADEQAALRDATALQGPETKALVAYFLVPPE